MIPADLTDLALDLATLGPIANSGDFHGSYFFDVTVKDWTVTVLVGRCYSSVTAMCGDQHRDGTHTGGGTEGLFEGARELAATLD